MRFRLDVDGEQRDIEVQPIAGGFVIRIEGAEYRARTRVAMDSVDVRIGAKERDSGARGWRRTPGRSLGGRDGHRGPGRRVDRASRTVGVVRMCRRRSFFDRRYRTFVAVAGTWSGMRFVTWTPYAWSSSIFAGLLVMS